MTELVKRNPGKGESRVEKCSKQVGRAVKLFVRETGINGLEETLINSDFFFS